MRLRATHLARPATGLAALKDTGAQLAARLGQDAVDAPGNERAVLAALMRHYEQWAHEMYPRVRRCCCPTRRCCGIGRARLWFELQRRERVGPPTN